ncbi:MbcA/ParS/Xre antitoxin family protein [Synechococcus elongatus]|uniref:MbcA/ParS/Xre antitoxin family protein n=1 Tax=Synechococcus elongatus PCC 11802 TaxID=2283154 RepID=A0AAT9JZ99_SYNEL|nr:MbcA/ParS/Xre antitoxin family protein [Synechococcus elongatus]
MGIGEWLMTLNPALAGQKPAEYMDTAEERRLVSRAIAMMRSGAYA